MSHQNNQPRTYSDGVTRTPGVPRWERVASLFLPTPGAEDREAYDDHGGTVEVHCLRHRDSDLSRVPYVLRVDNHETGESAAVAMSSRAAVAVAQRILEAVTHGVPESLSDAEYFGEYGDDGVDDLQFSAVDEHHSGVPGAPGNILRFPGAAGVDVSETMDHLMGEIRGHCTPEADGDQGDDTPDGAA